jgi:hypothetical protein
MPTLSRLASLCLLVIAFWVLGATLGAGRAQAAEPIIPTAPYLLSPLADYATDVPARTGCTRKAFAGTHLGVDCMKLAGTDVSSIGHGRVRFAGLHGSCVADKSEPHGNWGSLVVVGHVLSDSRHIFSVYGHVLPVVTVGQTVYAGQKLGTLMPSAAGDACWGGCTHLHFAVHDGGWSGAEGVYSSIIRGYGAASSSGYVDPDAYVAAHPLTKLDWACPAIEQLIQQGILTAHATCAEYDHVRPWSRAEVATILARAIGLPSVAGCDDPYADVPSSAYFHDAVVALSHLTYGDGVAVFRRDQTFRPEEPLTRARFLKVLYEAWNVTVPAAQAPFDDRADLEPGLERYVAKAVADGLVTFDAQHRRFRGADFAMIAEEATMLRAIMARYGRVPPTTADFDCQASVAACVNDECDALGQKSCVDGASVQYCGNWDRDPCLEERAVACDPGSVCVDGGCMLPLIEGDRPVGAACALDAECASHRCRAEGMEGEWRDGMCVAACDAGCPSGSLCAASEPRVCLPVCASDADCRAGYACVDASGGRACSPVAVDDAQPPATGGDAGVEAGADADGATSSAGSCAIRARRAGGAGGAESTWLGVGLALLGLARWRSLRARAAALALLGASGPACVSTVDADRACVTDDDCTRRETCAAGRCVERGDAASGSCADQWGCGAEELCVAGACAPIGGVRTEVTGGEAIVSPCSLTGALKLTWAVDDAAPVPPGAITWTASVAEPTVHDALAHAVTLWNSPGCLELTEAPSAKLANLRLGFYSKLSCADSAAVGCAEITPSCDVLQSALSVRVQLLAKPYASSSLIPIAAHEVGHALGLGHTNGKCDGTEAACDGSVMCCGVQLGATSLGVADRNLRAYVLGCAQPAACSCVDADHDGYYATSCADAACAPRTDCDDTRASVHPGASEVCGDGVDQDCAGGDLACACSCVDADHDGYYATSCADAACAPRTDCDDTRASVHPGATELACNGLDDDCSGGDLRASSTVENCASLASSCAANCDACQGSTTSVAYNQAGCGGQTCFVSYSTRGFDVMYARSTQTAYARWSFPALCAGNWRVYAVLPQISGSGLGAPPGCSSWRLATVTYNLKQGDTTLRTQVSDHSYDQGTRKLLFEGSFPGADGVTAGNAWTGIGAGCGHVLLDRIEIEPY